VSSDGEEVDRVTRDVDEIVHFGSPPVVEVIVGVALGEMGPDTGPLLSTLWHERLKVHFPNLELQPPYSAPVETFPEGAGSLNLQFELAVGLPHPRLWASSADGQELVQLQPGWFACNWRKVQPSFEYDRWRQRRQAFERWFGELSDFLAGEGLEPPKMTQCEVTYVNHIHTCAVWESHSQWDRVFAVSVPKEGPFRLEQVNAQAQFALESDGVGYGRLHAKMLPAFARDDRSPIFVFELTARGAPRGEGLAGVLAFLDSGRAAVDKTFVHLTTAEMHEEWEIDR
jgi:uncharacterized protein (TIGR04255 family)